jgi:hypothetical protein
VCGSHAGVETPDATFRYVNVDLIVPGFVSGFIWACAQIGWFVASDNLSMVVSCPRPPGAVKRP